MPAISSSLKKTYVCKPIQGIDEPWSELSSPLSACRRKANTVKLKGHRGRLYGSYVVVQGYSFSSRAGGEKSVEGRKFQSFQITIWERVLTLNCSMFPPPVGLEWGAPYRQINLAYLHHGFCS